MRGSWGPRQKGAGTRGESWVEGQPQKGRGVGGKRWRPEGRRRWGKEDGGGVKRTSQVDEAGWAMGGVHRNGAGSNPKGVAWVKGWGQQWKYQKGEELHKGTSPGEWGGVIFPRVPPHPLFHPLPLPQRRCARPLRSPWSVSS